jgi:putative nucleotidyltransferase with HDIG domain
LQNTSASTAEIGAMIAKDMAMTTKLVQVLNSAYFGLPRAITDPTEAVGILGFETIKSLILTVKVLSQYDKVKPVYFSIDNVWRHSTNVAQTARAMAVLETGDANCSSGAYTGGLMHDLGKVILAANFDDQYHQAHLTAAQNQRQLWQVEKEIFGVTHGEIGAYLLTLWGIPPEVVKVAALHHEPQRAGDKQFTALTAVHVANALEYASHPDPDGLPSPEIDLDYLGQMNLADRVELWKFARRESETAGTNTTTRFETRTHRTKPATTRVTKTVPAAPVPAPAAAGKPKREEPKKLSPLQALGLWLGIGLGVTGALVLLARMELNRLERVAQRSQAEESAESAPPVKPNVAPAAAPVAAAPAAAAPARAQPAAPAAILAAAPAAATSALDLLKLEAIFFSSGHPSALINGRLASVNQQVAECRVLDITPSSVTLQYQDQRRTLTLR